MKKERNKKIAFLLAVALLVELFAPIPYNATEAEAATSASISNESTTFYYTGGGAYDYSYSSIGLENMKPNYI